MSEKPKPKRRIRKTVTVTLAPETRERIERHLADNPQLASLGRSIDDLILNPSPNPRQDQPGSPAKANDRPK